MRQVLALSSHILQHFAQSFIVSLFVSRLQGNNSVSFLMPDCRTCPHFAFDGTISVQNQLIVQAERLCFRSLRDKGAHHCICRNYSTNSSQPNGNPIQKFPIMPKLNCITEHLHDISCKIPIYGGRYSESNQQCSKADRRSDSKILPKFPLSVHCKKKNQ